MRFFWFLMDYQLFGQWKGVLWLMQIKWENSRIIRLMSRYLPWGGLFLPNLRFFLQNDGPYDPCFIFNGWLTGERVGLVTWWLWVQDLVEGNFLSGVFSPLTSEKSSWWLWKESCVSTGVRKPGNMCVTNRHDMTLALKVALNPSTTNHPFSIFFFGSQSNASVFISLWNSIWRAIWNSFVVNVLWYKRKKS